MQLHHQAPAQWKQLSMVGEWLPHPLKLPITEIDFPSDTIADSSLSVSLTGKISEISDRILLNSDPSLKTKIGIYTIEQNCVLQITLGNFRGKCVS